MPCSPPFKEAAMETSSAAPPLPEFKDRRAGLIVFGIILIALGGLAALMIPLMLVGQLMSRHAPGVEPLPLRFMLPGVLVYLGAATAFVWLGIGSMMCRRWARALLLVLAWLWLIGGCMGMVFALFIMPQMFAQPQPGMPPLPPVARVMIMLFTLATCFVIYVLIPGVLVFFYQSRHVQATCAARDPVPRWTDACPLPVLALSLLLGFGAACMPFMVLFHGVVPFFGRYLSGAPGMVLLLASAVAYAWAARASYRRQLAGWWVAVLGYGLWMLSAAVTFARAGLLPMYERMGFPPAQLEQMQRMNFLHGPLLPVLTAICWLPFLGGLLYVRRYFKR